MDEHDIIDGAAETPTINRSLALQPTPTRTIVVNGREHDVTAETMGRDEIAALAFPQIGHANHGALTVAYDHGPAEAPNGLVIPGRSTRILHGQTFSVSLTDKS